MTCTWRWEYYNFFLWTKNIISIDVKLQVIRILLYLLWMFIIIIFESNFDSLLVLWINKEIQNIGVSLNVFSD